MTTPDNQDRLRWLSRVLEMVPGTISWAILILPLWLSFSYPWLVAYFVLSFDFYWLCRALWFSGAVIVAHRRIRDVTDTDWGERLTALIDPAARRAELAQLLAADGPPVSGHALGVVAGPGAGDRRGDSAPHSPGDPGPRGGRGIARATSLGR